MYRKYKCATQRKLNAFAEDWHKIYTLCNTSFMKQKHRQPKKPVSSETRSVVRWINTIIALAGIIALLLFSILYMMQYAEKLSRH